MRVLIASLFAKEPQIERRLANSLDSQSLEALTHGPHHQMQQAWTCSQLGRIALGRVNRGRNQRDERGVGLQPGAHIGAESEGEASRSKGDCDLLNPRRPRAIQFPQRRPLLSDHEVSNQLAFVLSPCAGEAEQDACPSKRGDQTIGSQGIVSEEQHIGRAR